MLRRPATRVGLPLAAPNPRGRSGEVVQTGEIVLAAPDGFGGYTLFGRFKLVDGSLVTPVFQGLQPPVIAIGEEGRDTQPYASSVIFEDNEAGIGILHMDPRRAANRVWWAPSDIRRRSQATLLRRKIDRGRPTVASGVAADDDPAAGGVYNNRVWVAWESRIRQYTESGGWTDGTAGGDRVLAGGAIPQNNPVAWEGGWFWPLGGAGFDYWSGSTWVHVATPCVGLVAYAGGLWFVDGVGQVYSTNIGASGAAAKIASGTFGAADFTARVRVSDQASGMMIYTTADASADVVPYVIGRKQLYQVDPSTFVAQPTGPQLPPHRFPMRAAALGSDNNVYLAQGLGVTQWSGDLAQPVGLDLDDGVPAPFKGGIVAMANGGLSLFALIDATRAEPDNITALTMGEPMMATVAGTLWDNFGYSWLASREPGGWHVRAVADAPGRAATMLFLSEAEGAYRVWFSWDGLCYSIDLEQGLYNPLDDVTAQYEPTGSLYYSVTDFTFKEAGKIALMAEVRTKRCSATEVVYPWLQYDEQGAWHPLRNADGTHGIRADGRHSFLLAANPTQADPELRDEPPIGRLNDYMQLRLDLERTPADAYRTPVIVFSALHALKTTRSIMAWQFTLDTSRMYNGLTGWDQRVLLRDLVDANDHGLLHFAYRPDPDGPSGKADLRAVNVVRFNALDQTGLPKDFRGRVNMTVSEVIKV